MQYHAIPLIGICTLYMSGQTFMLYLRMLRPSCRLSKPVFPTVRYEMILVGEGKPASFISRFYLALICFKYQIFANEQSSSLGGQSWCHSEDCFGATILSLCILVCSCLYIVYFFHLLQFEPGFKILEFCCWLLQINFNFQKNMKFVSMSQLESYYLYPSNPSEVRDDEKKTN